ncbi:MAG: ATP-binding protein, partial [Azoarcus sp.]|nr:ATP-binding protein [Azoarcus sp.]
VAMAVDGKSFVLNGAPGTGKSQTIANLIAHALEMGKRVLFVSGKQAALDAVGHRLQAVGLKDFTLDVHGSSVSMCAIRKQLKRSLRTTASGNEAGLKAALARHDDALAALRDYPDRVHSANVADFSLWTAHDTLAKLGDGPSWNLDPRFVGKIDVPGMKDAMTETVHIFRQIGASRDDPWLLVGLDDLGALTFTTLTRALTELSTARRKLDGFGRGWPDALRELRPGKYLTAMNACIEAARAGLLPGKAYFQDIARPSWRDAAAALRQKLVSFLETHRDTLATLTPELADSPLLNDWVSAATRLDKARFFAEIRRKSIRSAVAALVQPGTGLHGGNLLAALSAAQSMRDRAIELRSHTSTMAGLILPAEWAAYRPRALEEFDAAVQLGQLAVWLERHAPAAWLKAQEPCSANEIEALKEVAATWMRWLAVVGASERSIAQWLGRRSWMEAWDSDAPHWADDIAGTGLLQLQRHARLRKALQAIDRAGGRDLADKLANRAFLLDEAGSVMQRGLAAASLRERLVANGLTAFDDIAQARVVLAFQESARELRRLAVSTAPARLLARRVFQTDGLQSDMAALLRQIERKHGGMGLRELSARYPDALLALTPVFLMNPGSVAHFLDAGALKFDIVVFDEASRIQMPEAISAMGRGESVVIAGDPKQIPPEFMAASGSGSKTRAEAPESILGEAVDAGLPQLQLAWHYRSENEDLIAFSNAHYYENGLITLPSACRDANTGIVWRRLDGGFSTEKGHGNLAEAQAIVDEIHARFHDPARRRESIGVVCFDIRQRDLILNMLEESGDPLIHAALTEPPCSRQRLFVKDAGSAQGEERDIILCSLMFSPDPATNALPLDFGPLSGKDGERWLNVAITRACKQLALFT